jgi:hypothetical protein
MTSKPSSRKAKEVFISACRITALAICPTWDTKWNCGGYGLLGRVALSSIVSHTNPGYFERTGNTQRNAKILGAGLLEFWVLPRSVAWSGYSGASVSTPAARRGVNKFLEESDSVCFCSGKASVRENFSLFLVVPGMIQCFLKSLVFLWQIGLVLCLVWLLAGRATAQAASRWLPTAAARIQNRV